MGNAQEETQKRLSIAKREADRFRDSASGIILAGSVAYSLNLHVTEKSDLDLVVVTKHIKSFLSHLIEDDKERVALKHRFFEGYCLKNVVDGVPISIHVLSEDCFDIISKCFVADIRVYRPSAKEESYNLYGFERTTYPYSIKNIKLSDLTGVRTIVPVSFINKDKYFIGIHKDKLLSNPHILFEKKQYVKEKINAVWRNVVENLYYESMRLYGDVDLSRSNVINALAKKDKFSLDAKQHVEERTKHYLKIIK